MNANELANLIEKGGKDGFFQDEIVAILRQQQAEIEALKKQMPDWENINKPNPFIGWENQAKDLNPNSGLGGVALRKVQEKC